jgi:hypothetical protein
MTKHGALGALLFTPSSKVGAYATLATNASVVTITARCEKDNNDMLQVEL